MASQGDIKRVGKSGQILLGKQHAGEYFREVRQADGTILLTPVVWSQVSLERSRPGEDRQGARLGFKDPSEGLRRGGGGEKGREPEPACQVGLSSVSTIRNSRTICGGRSGPDSARVAKTLRKIRSMAWETLHRYRGSRWEAIAHIPAPNGGHAYSFRLSQKYRALAFRDGAFLRLLSLHLDHDSAYEGYAGAAVYSFNRLKIGSGTARMMVMIGHQRNGR